MGTAGQPSVFGGAGRAMLEWVLTPGFLEQVIRNEQARRDLRQRTKAWHWKWWERIPAWWEWQPERRAACGGSDRADALGPAPPHVQKQTGPSGRAAPPSNFLDI
jgi:hypothetical protein